MLSRANEMDIPTIYFLDDDLIEPCEIALSPKKFKMHSSPDRTRSIRNLIAAARCVYASTPNLSERLKSYNITNTIVSSKINCSPAHYIDIFKQKTISSTKTIGYMGFGHGADFKVAQFAIKSLMEKYEFLELELIGSIEIPEILENMKSRIKLYEPIFDYHKFLEFLHSLNWDVGICPLASTDFNFCKSINKWIEYSCCGIPTVATQGSIYDKCISNMCGILCDNKSESWYDALEEILFDENVSSTIRLNA